MLMRTIAVVLLAIAPFSLGAFAQENRIDLSVTDVDTGEPIASRVYLTSSDGNHYFFSPVDQGSAFKYEKQNWINKASIEYHTTISADHCFAMVPPGKYELVVERGKEYLPNSREIEFKETESEVDVSISLSRWIDMASRGWYSGDTHIHRSIDELRNVVVSEDLNVVFPLTNWVTIADTLPASGDKNLDIDLPDGLVKVDDTRVIWPLSTEYEIFSVAGKRHTLGALFVLGHKNPLGQTVPPWKPVIEGARKADPHVLFDMDKLSWPFAMLLPTLAPDATYELANNHMWRTEFAFREWYTRTPNYIQPPFGDTHGGERDWINFTLGQYYTLLDCGFRLPPSAGTANGVHPVPAGFGRVYVHLPDGFDYQQWREGLQQGRSFVTTGPMLFATTDGKNPGHEFQLSQRETREIPIHIDVTSEQPLTFGEVVINGLPEILLRPQNKPVANGRGYVSEINTTIKPTRSGWFAIRFWEDRPEGRVRFVHSAPWYVKVGEQPVLPRPEEKRYLIRRMTDEIQRSRGVVSAAGLAEYEQALEFYRSLDVLGDTRDVKRVARPLGDERDRWLRNMIVDHRFTPEEVRLATGLTLAEAKTEINKRAAMIEDSASSELRVLPYPGGRHPRTGFLDGAIDPQRETKISVFPPWKDGGYAVVDVPEAIFSNLGLTYLAHKHIPTIWTEQGIDLPRVEWQSQDGALVTQHRLPNRIVFGSRVSKDGDAVVMEMHLTNGTAQPLTGLRCQVCVMLKGLIGFNSQRRREQVVDGAFVAVKADESDRWIITAWQPLKRAWTNPPVPCIHSDPVFPDCQPGKTVRVRGHLWFYEGNEIEKEINRLSATFQ